MTQGHAAPARARARARILFLSRSNHLGQLNNFLVTRRDREGWDGGTSMLNSSTNSDGGNILPSLPPSLALPTTNSPALKITSRHDNVRCLCRVSSLSLFWALKISYLASALLN